MPTPDLDFKLKFSLQFFMVLALLVVTSASVVLLTPLPFLSKLLLLLMVLYEAICLKKRLFSPHAISHLKYQGNDRWQLCRGQQFYIAELKGDSLVTNWIIILRFSILPEDDYSIAEWAFAKHGKKQPQKYQHYLLSWWRKQKIVSCVICQDSLLPGYYQRLIVALRLS